MHEQLRDRYVLINYSMESILSSSVRLLPMVTLCYHECGTYLMALYARPV
uniref:Uncharacterized protein n=1 Tax=Parascaris univalens TaxID=6257 RepID=A0A915C6J0_PARUN